VGDAFVPLARAQADAVEYPDARLVVFEHPISETDADAVRRKGAELVDDVIAAFVG
jgi:hypothetical protein